MYDLSHILLGLTAGERWAATRRLSPRSEAQYWLVLLGVVVMAVLLVLLVAIGLWQRRSRQEQKAETFANHAQRRGLSARERQILLAVAMRSGLANTSEISREREVFLKGVAQLLAECARTRPPQEVEALKAELARLGQKLGFQKAAGFGPSHSTPVHDHRRFPRVAVRRPGLVAHWPLVRSARAVPGAADTDLSAYAPAFVESTVTELAGPGLRVETRLQVQVADRILVIFPLAEGTGEPPTGRRIVAAVGRVKRGGDLEHGVRIPDAIDHVWNGSPQRNFRALVARPSSIAVELMDLDAEEIEELASVTSALSSRAQAPHADGTTGPGEPAAFVTTAHAVPLASTGAERHE